MSGTTSPWACRVGAELGADLIKTRYSGSVSEFRRSVEACGQPVLVAGGPRREAGLSGALGTVSEVLEAGASGVIFGRQVWQHDDPCEAVSAIAELRALQCAGRYGNTVIARESGPLRGQSRQDRARSC